MVKFIFFMIGSHMIYKGSFILNNHWQKDLFIFYNKSISAKSTIHIKIQSIEQNCINLFWNFHQSTISISIFKKKFTGDILI